MSRAPIRSVLIAAMGGQGGGVLTDWLVQSARLAGLAVLGMWLASGHDATWRNWMALLLNPLWWLLLLPAFYSVQRAVWWILLAMLAVGVAILAWPGGPQFRLDQLLLLVPVCLALLWVAHKRLVWLQSGD